MKQKKKYLTSQQEIKIIKSNQKIKSIAEVSCTPHSLVLDPHHLPFMPLFNSWGYIGV